MKNSLLYLAYSVIALSMNSVFAGDRFSGASIHLEQNVTDNDMEVIIKANSGDDGIASLQVVAPKGKKVVDFKAPDLKLGLRSFNFESPEPKNKKAVQDDYPAGEYTFTGKLVNGKSIQGKAKLEHKMPDSTQFVFPLEDSKKVPIKDLVLKWKPVKNTKSYAVTVEQEESGYEFKTDVSGETTELAVPNGFLRPGTEYKLSIGVLAKTGNATFSEIDFETAE